MANNGTLVVYVKNIATGESVPGCRFIVNENNVGDPQIDIPVPMRQPGLYPSLKPPASYSPVVWTGEATDGLPVVVSLPEGKYVLSVLAPGYKMGGNWTSITPNGTTTIEVSLQPNPLPLAKIRVHVFHDNNPVNGEDDVPVEPGLEGFLVLIGDAVGEVTVDYFGNPLGTRYEQDADGNYIYDQDGNPVPVPATGGIILTDAGGNAVIENLPPGKYEVQAIPPDGTDWIQTSTIEGTPVIDVWVEEGNDGYSTEEGFQMPLVWFGFVKPMAFPANPGEPPGTVHGRILTIVDVAPPTTPASLGDPVYKPWIALTDLGANDQQVYTGRGNEQGYFSIENVPPSTYQLVIWDEPLDYIISFRTVIVGPGDTVDMGDIGVPRWFGKIQGKVFYDHNGNAVPEPDEPGIAMTEVGTRYKDGSVQYGTMSDMQGNYALNEVFELERFAIAEVGFTRLEQTGATGVTDNGLPPPLNTETFPGALTLAEVTWAGSKNVIDWGKKTYGHGNGENGGITGIVYYATMRNETNPRRALPEDYEPGVPGVVMNLYSTVEQEGKIVQGTLINSATSDAWTHPTGCVDVNGQPVPCTEVPLLGNQIRQGVFDGGYAFATYFDPYYGAPDAVEKPLQEGVYIVEAIPPAGFKAIDENGSVNTSDGDQFVFQNGNNPAVPVPVQAGNVAGFDNRLNMHVTLAPYYEPPENPGHIDIHKKVVKVIEQRNTAADFFLYTDVPVPGRIIGLLVDDLNLQSDPNSILFGEKRGIPETPIGIRDYTGRLITTVHSDVNGYFEVLLPSTYTRNVPTPSGVAPGMYRFIGNDPGDPDQPNERFNPDYQTLNLVFDLWPGKTTYADVALMPVTAFVQVPGAQFSPPPACRIPDTVPQLFAVSRVEADADDPIDNNRTFTIAGRGFGDTTGSVSLNGVHIAVVQWGPEQISVLIPDGFPVSGPAQLTVTNALGNTSPFGITFHLRRQGQYWPAVVTVKKDGSGDYATVQEAVDQAPDQALIVVHPGRYYESPIVYKPVKLQGAGPGGIKPDGGAVEGAVLDGRFFRFYQDDWLAKLQTIDFDGAQGQTPAEAKNISDGQVVTVVAQSGAFVPEFNTLIDGFTIQGGRGQEAGGIYVNAHCHYLEIGNNFIRNNGGGFGGAITVGKAYRGSNLNHHLLIRRNRVIGNGGVSLAGAIGIYNGADHYVVELNHICGNYSAEYGGGISHYGYSANGQIRHNHIEYNASFDEGGGILAGGEKPVPPQLLSAGSGEIAIYGNMIRGNLANDDGGGIRLLAPGQDRITIYNNMIVNNVSTDLGGGIALDDASSVVIMNNTVAKNITTATAEDSDGNPHGTGLISEKHSAAFQASLPPDAPDFSNPVLFNNIFWDNRAGYFRQDLNGGLGGIYGLGYFGEQPDIMDLEVFGTAALDLFHPEYCSLTEAYGGGNHNLFHSSPLFADEVDLQISVMSFNGEPTFKVIRIVTAEPYNPGDYHLTEGSPVIGQGTSQVASGSDIYDAPHTDYDGDARPTGTGYDIGADQFVHP